MHCDYAYNPYSIIARFEEQGNDNYTIYVAQV